MNLMPQHLLIAVLLWLGSGWWLSLSAQPQPQKLRVLQNLQQDLQTAKQQGRIILLEVSASYCGYCRTLEREIIQPMLISGDYRQRVMFRQLSIDANAEVIDAQGRQVPVYALAQSLAADLTPTLLFLGADGKELAERMIGVYSLDYYGYFVDLAIDAALLKQRQNKTTSEN